MLTALAKFGTVLVMQVVSIRNREKTTYYLTTLFTSILYW